MATTTRAHTRKFESAIRRRALRERAISYKGGRCVLCGYHKCPAALDFHHLSPLEKDYDISSRVTSWHVLVGELNKCILVCATCHREIHDGLHPRYLEELDSDRGGDGDFLDDEDAFILA